MNYNLVKTLFSFFVLGAFVFVGVEEELKKINQKLDGISSRLTQLEKKVTSQAAPSNKKPQADPNKVYDIADAGSVVLGDPNAKVTIVKWTDFQ